MLVINRASDRGGHHVGTRTDRTAVGCESTGPRLNPSHSEVRRGEGDTQKWNRKIREGQCPEQPMTRGKEKVK